MILISELDEQIAALEVEHAKALATASEISGAIKFAKVLKERSREKLAAAQAAATRITAEETGVSSSATESV
jgi:hypothetical protein